ncbi:MAG: hypothetical protein ABGF52_12030 [Candidatus Asgardarchaeum sp.]
MKSFVSKCLEIQKKLNKELETTISTLNKTNYFTSMKNVFLPLKELYTLMIEAYEPYIELSQFDHEYFTTSLNYVIRRFKQTEDDEKKKDLAKQISAFREKLNEVEDKLNSYMSEKWAFMGIQWLIEMYTAKIENRTPNVDYFVKLSSYVTENFENALVDERNISIDGLDEMRDGLIRKGIAKTVELESQEKAKIEEVFVKGLLSEQKFYRFLEQVIEFRESILWVALSPFPENLLRHILRYVSMEVAEEILKKALNQKVEDKGLLSELKVNYDEVTDTKLSVEIDLLASLFEKNLIDGYLNKALEFGSLAIDKAKKAPEEHHESELEKRIKTMYPLAKIEQLRRELKGLIKENNIEKAVEIIENMRKTLRAIDKKKLDHDMLTLVFAVKNMVEQLRFALKENPTESEAILKDFEEEQTLKIESLLSEAEKIISEDGFVSIARSKETFMRFDAIIKKLTNLSIWISEENGGKISDRVKTLLNIRRWALGINVLQFGPFDKYLLQGLRARIRHYLWLSETAELYKKIGFDNLSKECEDIAKLALKDAFSKEATNLLNVTKMWVYRAYRKRRKHIFEPIIGEGDVSLMSDAIEMEKYEQYHDNAIKIYNTLSDLFKEAKISAEDKREEMLFDAISMLHKADAMRLEAAKLDGLAERAAFLQEWWDAEKLYDKAGEMFNKAAAYYAAAVKAVREGKLGQFAAEMAEFCKRLAIFEWEQRKNVSDRTSPTFKQEELLGKIYRQL